MPNDTPPRGPLDHLFELIDQGLNRFLEAIGDATDFAGRSVNYQRRRIGKLLSLLFVSFSKIMLAFIQLLILLLAPAYLTSFGDELINHAKMPIAGMIIGWIMMAVGGIIISLLLGGLILSFFKSKRQKRRVRAEVKISMVGNYLIFLDFIFIVVVATTLIAYPAYHFQSPLLHATEVVLERIHTIVRVITLRSL